MVLGFWVFAPSVQERTKSLGRLNTQDCDGPIQARGHVLYQAWYSRTVVPLSTFTKYLFQIGITIGPNTLIYMVCMGCTIVFHLICVLQFSTVNFRRHISVVTAEIKQYLSISCNEKVQIIGT